MRANKSLDITHLGVFHHMRDSVSSESNLEMCPNGRNDAPMLVGVAESFKSPMFYFREDIEEHEEQVRDNQVGIQAPRGGPT